ncbi:hypothetical protein NDU88_006614 [Pleurodeles waltl]|uniref:Uncharacterized protein n=1 Tax=Pleurodeles waltl TaxID=8319 RepID=A0AAV7QL93_PLEWA|nr:hypothetical protein NDU88_006614 [Pleurodeles waltl]
MDHLVHQLHEGQQKLEWALKKHMKQAEINRTAFANAIRSQGDNLTKMAEGQTQMLAGIGLSRGSMVSGTMVPLQKCVPGEVPVVFFLNFE